MTISPRLASLFGYGGPNAYFPAVWFAEADDAHLTDEERKREESLRQGVSPIRFVPLRSCEVSFPGHGARAGSGRLSVDAHTGCSVRLGSAWAWARSLPIIPVQCGRVVPLAGYSAQGGTTSPPVFAGASFLLSGVGARAHSARMPAAGGAEVALAGVAGICRSRRNLNCLTVKNPTDEEVISWFMLHRA